MVPSGIKRIVPAPFRTRRLENGTVVVEDAYEGSYTFSTSRNAGMEIKGLQVETPERKKVDEQE